MRRSAAGVPLLVGLLLLGLSWARAWGQPPVPPEADPRGEVEAYYGGVDETTRQYLIWSNTTFRQAGLWVAQGAFGDLTPEQLEARKAEWLATANGPPGRNQCLAIESLGAIGCQEALPALLAIATNRGVVDNRTRWLAVRSLGRIGDESAILELIYLVDYFNENTRNWAKASLYRLTGEWFGDDREAWGQWWNEQGGDPPYVAEKRYPSLEEAQAVYEGRAAAPAAPTEVGPPEAVPVVRSVPLVPGLEMEIEWSGLAARPGNRLYQCAVTQVTELTVTYRMRHNDAEHTIMDRVGAEAYTGNWSNRGADQLEHTWPWIPVARAEALAAGQPGETRITLRDLVANQTREYLLLGEQMLPCTSEGKPVLVRCWVLASGNGAYLAVLTDPANPLVVESYEPGVSTTRLLSLVCQESAGGPGGAHIEFE